MAAGKLPLDWGMAETLAYASLLSNGYDVRLSGQDSGRGTFAHRHAVLHDQKRERWDEGIYIPLQNIGKDQGDFVVIDSVLSEEAVLGFEYGYSHRRAQRAGHLGGAVRRLRQRRAGGDGPVHRFGRDQVGTRLRPGACSCRTATRGRGRSIRRRASSATCSSAPSTTCRCACRPTPAQIFHLLRRQMLRPFRKPLVVMTPKSLLRKKEAASAIHELANGSFQTVIPDATTVDEKAVKRDHRLLRQGLLRPGRGARERKDRRHCDHPAGAALSVPAQEFEAEIEALPECDRSGLVPGRAAEPGRVVPDRGTTCGRTCATSRSSLYAGRPRSASPAVGYMARHNDAAEAARWSDACRERSSIPASYSLVFRDPVEAQRSRGKLNGNA